MSYKMWCSVDVVCMVWCVTSSLTWSSPASTTSAPDNQYTATAGDNYSFINAIRRNLRRNNEDYVAEQTVNRHRETLSEAAAVAPFIGAARPAQSAPAARTTRVRSEVRQLNKKTPAADETSHTPNNDQGGRNTNKRQHRDPKLKRLADKSKDLIRYVSSSSTLGTRGRPGRLGTLSNTRKPTSRPVERARSSLRELFTRRPRGLNGKPPSADRLDGAPARGAFVSNVRAKGALCHRHVLWPEGPKYDGRGDIVMPMYRPGLYEGKDFSQTRKPRLVLPRCCNCCKKSVLGCQ